MQIKLRLLHCKQSLNYKRFYHQDICVNLESYKSSWSVFEYSNSDKHYCQKQVRDEEKVVPQTSVCTHQSRICVKIYESFLSDVKQVQS